jgi:large subunit ribosomal protein L3
VFKGNKMARHKRAEQVKTLKLQDVLSDAEKGLIFVRGAVPGSKGGWVLVRDAIKKKLPDGLPFPAALKSDAALAEAAPETVVEDAPVESAPAEEEGKE